MRPTPTPHEVHIDIAEISMHGFPRIDRHRLAHAINTELTRLLGSENDQTRYLDSTVDQVRGKSVGLSNSVDATYLGVAIAGSIAESVRALSDTHGVSAESKDGHSREFSE
jgi:hypothetical protein